MDMVWRNGRVTGNILGSQRAARSGPSGRSKRVLPPGKDRRIGGFAQLHFGAAAARSGLAVIWAGSSGGHHPSGPAAGG